MSSKNLKPIINPNGAKLIESYKLVMKLENIGYENDNYNIVKCESFYVEIYPSILNLLSYGKFIKTVLHF